MPKTEGSSGRLVKKSEKEESEEENNVYEMEDILEFKKEGNQSKWKVKWKGYPIEQSTWEPEGNILNPGKEIYDKMSQLKKMWEATSNSKKNKKVESPTASKKRSKSDEQHGDDEPPKEETKKRRSSRAIPAAAAAKAEESDLSPVSGEAEQGEPKNNNYQRTSSQKEVTEATTASTAELEEKDIDNSKGKKKDDKGRGNPVVSHMREQHGEQQVCIEWSRDDHEWQSIDVARKLYANELLDYLLSRVRFRPCAPGRKA